MHALIHATAAPGQSRRWFLAASIALALSFAPHLLFAESIIVEQGNQVTRPSAVTVNAGEEITVRDPASRLDVQDALTVNGGTISVSASGTLNTATIAGHTVLSDGAQATVDGPGSLWNAGGWFQLGQTGDARLTISDGGRMHSGFSGITTIASSGQATASTLVTGIGSVWDAGQVMTMGRGEFSILDGGAVTVGFNANFGVPDEPRGPIKIVVAGPGSTWSVGNLDMWTRCMTLPLPTAQRFVVPFRHASQARSVRRDRP
jgi:T5SS/PEP-CTERM-associated repeat protein